MITLNNQFNCNFIWLYTGCKWLITWVRLLSVPLPRSSPWRWLWELLTHPPITQFIKFTWATHTLTHLWPQWTTSWFTSWLMLPYQHLRWQGRLDSMFKLKLENGISPKVGFPTQNECVDHKSYFSDFTTGTRSTREWCKSNFWDKWKAVKTLRTTSKDASHARDNICLWT